MATSVVCVTRNVDSSEDETIAAEKTSAEVEISGVDDMTGPPTIEDTLES